MTKEACRVSVVKTSLAMPLKPKLTICLLFGLVGAVLTGCRAHGIDITIQNNGQASLRNVELDYPGAAFGTGAIAPGASFWYHIKPTADGELTLSFEQDDGKTFKQKGPTVHAADRGRLVLILEQDAGKQWHLRVEHSSQ